MRLKYSNYISQIDACPPYDARERNIRSYRFVFSEMSHPDNFKPVLVKSPRRCTGTGFQNPRNMCSGFAISLFSSREKALVRYRQLLHSIPNIHKSIGTHVAEGEIEPSDGLTTEVDRSGHFDLHEYAEANLPDKFRIVLKVHD